MTKKRYGGNTKYKAPAISIVDILRNYRIGKIESAANGVSLPQTYTATLNNLLTAFSEETIFTVIRKITEYVDARQAGEIGTKPAGNGTIVKELKCLQAALNWSFHRNYLPPEIIKPFAFKLGVKAPDPKPFFLNKSETYRLLDAACWMTPPPQGVEDVRKLPDALPRIYLFCLLGLDTAARYRTILDLKWTQLDFDKKRMNLLGSNKRTSKRKPVIAMSERLYQVLKMHREKNPDDVYILGHSGDIRKSFARAAKRAGLPEEITPHTLRHTFATLSLQRGVPPFQVAQVMGDTVQTVMSVYGHHCPDYTRAAVDAMA